MNLLKDITIGQYVPRDSLIHDIDPRIKIAIITLFMTQLFLIHSWTAFGVMFVFLLTITILSRIPVSYVLRGLKPIVILVMITLVFNLFFSKGTAIWQHKFYAITLSITQEGLESGFQMALRLIMLVFATSMLTLTTSPIQLTDALENILTPFSKVGIPAHELAMMMSIALRFIPVLIEETDRIIKAQRSRGAALGRGNIIEKAKSLLPILVPLFVHAFKHAEDLAVAMESRCYRGGKGRTRLKQLIIKTRDFAAVMVFGVISAVVALWDFYGIL